MHGVTVSAHFYYRSEFFFTREVILYGHALRGHAPRKWAGLESQALAPPPRAHPQVPSPPARCSATTGCCLALTLETNDGPLLPLHSVSLISRLPGAFRPGWELHRTLRFHTLASKRKRKMNLTSQNPSFPARPPGVRTVVPEQH